MNKLIKILITTLISLVIIIVLATAIKIVFMDKFDGRDSDHRVNLDRFLTDKNYESLLSIADMSYEANEELTDSAPKQTVTALWNVMDKQSIIVNENIDLLNQNYELAEQNDNLIIQNEILINGQYKTQKILILFITLVSMAGISIISLIVWKVKE